MSTLDVASLGRRLESVRERIASSAVNCGRSPDDVTLVVVTKFHGADLVRALADLGVRDVGENRHQEAEAKHLQCSDLDLRWHFIGQLQSNKAAAVRRYADVVHSVDRDSVVAGLERAGLADPGLGTLDCLIQINLTDDPGRGGVQPENLDALATQVMSTTTLRLRGLMAVAPLGENPEPAFEAVAMISENLRRLAPDATWLSMGMSGDFESAISFGATHLRIGTEITGKRPNPV